MLVVFTAACSTVKTAPNNGYSTETHTTDSTYLSSIYKLKAQFDNVKSELSKVFSIVTDSNKKANEVEYVVDEIRNKINTDHEKISLILGEKNKLMMDSSVYIRRTGTTISDIRRDHSILAYNYQMEAQKTNQDIERKLTFIEGELSIIKTGLSDIESTQDSIKVSLGGSDIKSFINGAIYFLLGLIATHVYSRLSSKETKTRADKHKNELIKEVKNIPGNDKADAYIKVGTDIFKRYFGRKK